MGVAVLACLLTIRHFGAAYPSHPLLSSDRGVLPNRAFTPGATRQASLEEVCALRHEEVVRPVSAITAPESSLEEYGIPAAQSDDVYELDYLITPGLGGEDDIHNLWPEPQHAATWNAYAKDVLEERLHEMVCSRQLDLAVAQEAIATNWIAAYQKYVQAVPRNTQAVRASSPTQVASSTIFIKDAEMARPLRDM